MRILIVGAGGVGSSAALIATRRDFFEHCVVADYDLARAEALVARLDDERFVAAPVDASSAEAVAGLARLHGATHVVNAVDPRFVMSIFDGAFAAGAHYLDIAMSLSSPHPDQPSRARRRQARRPPVREGALSGRRTGASRSWAWASSQAVATSSRATPATTSSTRSTSSASATARNLVVEGYEFAPSFSIWTTIEECLNPPAIWEKDRGWFTTAPFSEPEVFDFPERHRAGRVRQRGARGGPAHAALDQGAAGDVQVRPRRRVHRRAEDPAQARPGPDRADQRRRRRGLPARRRRGCAARPG